MRRHIGSSLFLLVQLLALTFAAAAEESDRPPTDVLDLGKVTIQIVDATFVSELSGIRRRFKASKPDKYRGLVLTVKFKKPAGKGLTLRAQDFSLHYRRGSKSDVLPCNGISVFSKTQDVDRPMKLLPRSYGSMTTGTSTLKSAVIYVDLFFQRMEPDTTDLYLLVAQPVGASFVTNGWK